MISTAYISLNAYNCFVVARWEPVNEWGWSGLLKSNWSKKIHSNWWQFLSFTVFLLRIHTLLISLMEKLLDCLKCLLTLVNLKVEFHLINVNCSQYPDGHSCLKIWLKDYCEMRKQLGLTLAKYRTMANVKQIRLETKIFQALMIHLGALTCIVSRKSLPGSPSELWSFESGLMVILLTHFKI